MRQFLLGLLIVLGAALAQAQDPTQAVIPDQQNLQFTLIWRAGARLSLEVRDPNGASLSPNSPQSADGGSFGGDTDPVDCQSASPHRRTQTITWPSFTVGSYEIQVYYLDGCTTSVPFGVTASIGGQSAPAHGGTLNADQVYTVGYEIGSDGSGQFAAQEGFVGASDTVNIATADLLAAAQPLPVDGAAQGHIGNGQPYLTYQFEGRLGDLISITLTHTSGSLDPYVALMDERGNLVAYNDDRADGVTDASIDSARLRHDGTYYVVVTRYGQLIGATEGDFTLMVTGAGG